MSLYDRILHETDPGRPALEPRKAPKTARLKVRLSAPPSGPQPIREPRPAPKTRKLQYRPQGDAPPMTFGRPLPTKTESLRWAAPYSPRTLAIMERVIGLDEARRVGRLKTALALGGAALGSMFGGASPARAQDQPVGPSAQRPVAASTAAPGKQTFTQALLGKGPTASAAGQRTYGQAGLAGDDIRPRARGAACKASSKTSGQMQRGETRSIEGSRSKEFAQHRADIYKMPKNQQAAALTKLHTAFQSIQV